MYPDEQAGQTGRPLQKSAHRYGLAWNMMLSLWSGESLTELSHRWRRGDTQIMMKCSNESVVNIAHSREFKAIGATLRNVCRLTLFAPCSIMNARQLVDIMKRLLFATAAILAFAAPSFAAEPAKEPAKTVGQAPSTFYLAQDSATLKCQIVEAPPAAGSTMKVVGVAHATKASAETALQADKTCKL